MFGKKNKKRRYSPTYAAVLGNRQQSRFLALVSDYDRLAELTEEAANSEDAATLQTLKTLDSLESKIQQLQTAWQSFYANLGLEEVFKSGLDFLTRILNNLNNVPKAFGKIPIAAISIVANLISVVKNLGTLMLESMSATWTRISEAIKEKIKNGVVEGNKEGNAAVERGEAATSSTAAKNSLDQKLTTGKKSKVLRYGGMALSTLGTALSTAGMTMGDEQAGTRGAMKIGGAVSSFLGSVASGASVGGVWGGVAGGIIGIIGQLGTLTSGFYDVTHAEELNTKATLERIEKLKQESLVQKNEVKQLSSTINKLEELEEAKYSSNEAYQEWLDYKQQIADSYPELIKSYTAEGEAVIDLGDAYIKLAEDKEKAAGIQAGIALETVKIAKRRNKRIQNASFYGQGEDTKAIQVGEGSAFKTIADNSGNVTYWFKGAKISEEIFKNLLSEEMSSAKSSDLYGDEEEVTSYQVKGLKISKDNVNALRSDHSSPLYEEYATAIADWLSNNKILKNDLFENLIGISEEELKELANDTDRQQEYYQTLYYIADTVLSSGEEYAKAMQAAAEQQRELGAVSNQLAHIIKDRIENEKISVQDQKRYTQLMDNQLFIGAAQYQMNEKINTDSGFDVTAAILGEDYYSQIGSFLVPANKKRYIGDKNLQELLSDNYIINLENMRDTLEDEADKASYDNLIKSLYNLQSLFGDIIPDITLDQFIENFSSGDLYIVNPDKYTEFLSEISEELFQAFNQLTDDQQAEIMGIISHPDRFRSKEDFKQAIEAFEGKIDDALYNYLINTVDTFWEDNSTGARENAYRNISNSAQNSSSSTIRSRGRFLAAGFNEDTDMFELSADFASRVNNQWRDLVLNVEKSGQTLLAEMNAEMLNSVYRLIGDTNIFNGEIGAQKSYELTEIMAQADLSTREGIQATIDTLKDYEKNTKGLTDGQKANIAAAITELTNLRENLIVNINTELNSYVAALDKGVEAAKKVTKSQTSGFDKVEDIESVLSTINANREDKLGFKDVFNYDEDSGKITYSMQGYVAAYEAIYGDLDERYEQLIKDIDNQADWLDEKGKIIGISGYNANLDKYKSNGWLNDSNFDLHFNQLAKQNKWDEDQKRFWSDILTEFANQDESWDKFIATKIEQLGDQKKQAEELSEIADQMVKDTTVRTARKAVDIKGIAEGTKNWEEARGELYNWIAAEVAADEKWLNEQLKKSEIQGYKKTNGKLTEVLTKEGEWISVEEFYELSAQQYYDAFSQGGQAAWEAYKAMDGTWDYDTAVELYNARGKAQNELISEAVEKQGQGFISVNGAMLAAFSDSIGTIDEAAGPITARLENGEIQLYQNGEAIGEAITDLYETINTGLQNDQITLEQANKTILGLSSEYRNTLSTKNNINSISNANWDNLDSIASNLGREIKNSANYKNVSSFINAETGAITDYLAFLRWLEDNSEGVEGYDDHIYELRAAIKQEDLSDPLYRAYLNGIKNANKAIIESNKSVETNINQEINDLIGGKIGDEIDVTYLNKTYSDLLEKYGFSVENGITKITGTVYSFLTDLSDEEDIDPLVLAQIRKSLNDIYKAASTEIGNGIGSKLSATTVEMLKTHTAWDGELNENNEYVIRSAEDYLKAANALYEVTKLNFKNGELSLEELNENAIKTLDSNLAAQKAGYEITGKGSLTSNDLGEFFTTVGERVDEYIDTATGELTDEASKYMTRTGIGSYEFKSWDAMQKYYENINIMLEEGTRDYIQARALWVKSQEGKNIDTRLAALAKKSGNFGVEDFEELQEIMLQKGFQPVDIQELMNQARETADGWDATNILLAVLKEVYSNSEIPDSIQEGFRQGLSANVYSNLKNLNDFATDGFANLNEIEGFRKTLTGLGAGSWERSSSNALYNWNEITQKYEMTSFGYQTAVQSYLDNLYQSIIAVYDNTEAAKELFEQEAQHFLEVAARNAAAAVDIEGYLNSERTETDAANLQHSIDLWLEAERELGNELNFTSKEIVEGINNGSISILSVAQTIAKRSGKQWTTADTEKYLYAREQALIDAAGYLDRGIGEVISKEAADVLEKAGYGLLQIEGTNDYVITALGDNLQAWESYYETISAKLGRGSKEAKEARGKILQLRKQPQEMLQKSALSLDDIETLAQTNKLGITTVGFNQMPLFKEALKWTGTEFEVLDAVKYEELLETLYGPIENLQYHAQALENDIQNQAAKYIGNVSAMSETDIANMLDALGLGTEKGFDSIISAVEANAEGKRDLTNLLPYILKQAGVEEERIQNLYRAQVDNILQGFDTITSTFSSGFGSIDSAKSYFDSIGAEFNNGYVKFNEATNSYIFTSEGLATSWGEYAKKLSFVMIHSGASAEEIRQALENQLTNMQESLASQVNISSILRDNTDFSAFRNNFTQLQTFLRTFVQDSNLLGQSAEEFAYTLRQGGQQAVDAAQELAQLQGKVLSADEVTELYRASADKLVAAGEELLKKPGEIIGESAAKILQSSNNTVTQIEGTSQYIINDINNLNDALLSYYTQIRNTTGATVEEINKALVQWYNKQYSNSTVIDALSKGTGMSFDGFAQIYTDIGKELHLEDIPYMIQQGIIKQLDNGNIQILDFARFSSSQLGTNWEINSQEDLEAFKAYRQGLLDYDEKVTNGIKDELNILKSTAFKVGDKFDMTYLTEGAANGAEITNALNTSLKNLGLNIENGVLTVGENFNGDMYSVLTAMRNVFIENNLDESAREVTEAIRGYLNSAISGLSSYSAGMTVSGEAAQLLVHGNHSSVFSQKWQAELSQYNEIVIDSIYEYQSAVIDIYAETKKAFEQGLVGLSAVNNAYLNKIKAFTFRETNIRGLLGNNGIFDLDTLANIFSSFNVELSTYFDTQGNVIGELAQYISKDSEGNYHVTKEKLHDFFYVLGLNLDRSSAEYVDTYLSLIQNDPNFIKTPENQVSTLISLMPNMAALTYDQLGTIAKTYGLAIENVLASVSNNGNNTFNASGLVTYLKENFGKGNKLIDEAWSKQVKSAGQSLLSALVTYANSEQKVSDIRNWMAAKKAFKEATGGTINLLAYQIELGGQAAVQAAQQIMKETGAELSASDIESIYRAQIRPLVDAIDNINVTAGAIINEATANIINKSGGAAIQLGQTGQYVVTSAANLVEAYDNLLKEMEKTGEATLADLNKIEAMKMAEKAGRSTINVLGDAASMNFERLGEILADANIRMTDELVRNWKDFGILKNLGGGNVAITDFNTFAELTNLEIDPNNNEAYVSALKSWNDAMIQMNQQAERNIGKELQNVLSAQRNSQVNLTELYMKLENTEAPAATIQDDLEEYGASFVDGILTLGDNANIPKIIEILSNKANEAGVLLTQDALTLADSLDEYFKNLSDAISKGISGTLTNTEAFNLQQIITSLDLDVALEFTKTAEGLKLTQSSVFELYDALKGVEDSRAPEVLKSMVEALENTSGSGFQNISETMAQGKITKVYKDIEVNQEKINALVNDSAGGHEAEIAKLEEKNAALREQIFLYQDIARSQSMNPDSFSFMDRDLPTGLQGPQNYWNSVGEAYKAMNSASKSGYMEIQDFYNIVNEMSNLAAMSGQSFEFMGQTIDGSAENAAVLINAGLGALSNIDGEGVKISLSELGKVVDTSASAMTKDFDSAVREMARGQIAMLDAQIALLEAVVAMEDLGKIDTSGDNVIDLGEIFNLETPGDFTEEYNSWRTNLINKLNDKELRETFEQVKIGTHSLYEILNTDADELQKLGLSMDDYQKLINTLYQMSISGDYDLNDLFNSIQKMFEGGSGQVLNFSDKNKTRINVGGVGVEVNWEKNDNGEYINEALQNYFTNNPEVDPKTVKSQFEQYLSGEIVNIPNAVIELAIGQTYIDVTEDGGPTQYRSLLTGQTYPSIEALKYDVILAKSGLNEGSSDFNSKELTTGEGQHEHVTGTKFTWTSTLDGSNFITEIIIDTNGVTVSEVYKVEGYDKTFDSYDEAKEAALYKAWVNEQQYSGVDLDKGFSMKDSNQAYQTWKINRGVQVQLAGNITLGQFVLGKSGEAGNILDLILTGKTEEAKGKLEEVFKDFNIELPTLENGDTDWDTIISWLEGTVEFTEQTLTLTPGDDITKAMMEAIETRQINAELVLTPRPSTGENVNGDNTNDHDPSEDAYNSGIERTKLKVVKPGQLEIPDSGTGDKDAVAQTLAELNKPVVTIQDVMGTLLETVRGIADNVTTLVSMNIPGESGTGEDNTTNTINTAIFTDAAISVQTSLDEVGSKFDSLKTDHLIPLLSAAALIESPLNGVTNTLNNLSAALKDIPASKDSLVRSLASQMKNIPSGKDTIVKNLANAMSKISGSYSIKINLTLSTTGSKGAITEATMSGGSAGKKLTNTKFLISAAKGKALASGTRKTLMGELGPELVVSNGSFFVAGENGAEFVDLDKDAIVFNHLQTKKLLSSGSSGRGTPITNERNAVSLATGTTGPAMASAQQALAALKEIRAMWQSMLDASARQLGSQAGRGTGGGSGGNGGNGGKTLNQAKSATWDIQRWYNLLRQIARLESQITYEEQIQNKLASEREANGKGIYDSYRLELQYLDEEIAREKELLALQETWLENRIQDIVDQSKDNHSILKNIFTYDVNKRLLQYKGNGEPDSRVGLDILEHINRRDENNKPIKDAATAEKQLIYLRERANEAGMNTLDFYKVLTVNNDGTRIVDFNSKGNQIDPVTKERITDINTINDNMLKMVENFYDMVDGAMNEIDSLQDSIVETETSILEQEQKVNEILQKIVDNQLSVEQTVLQAIVDREQAIIDGVQEQRDALDNAANKFLTGLDDQLRREQDMYNQNQSDNELTKLQRQLAILQRSGGSSSQIRNLQQQISQKQQDKYFEQQQKQIDAIQEASDKQIERLDEQISLMTETLAYQREHGLLWDEVYRIMHMSQEDIEEFITANGADWEGKSELQLHEDLRKISEQIGIWIGDRDAETSAVASEVDLGWRTFVKAYKEYYGKAIETNEEELHKTYNEYMKTGDTAYADAIVREILDGINGQTVVSASNTDARAQILEDLKKRRSYAEGGLSKETGLAILHGSKNNPELVLTAEQTKNLRQGLLGGNTLTATLADLNDILGQMATNNVNNENNGIYIDKIELSMNVSSIANDYDARRAGAAALDEMVRIARKTGSVGLSRR